MSPELTERRPPIWPFIVVALVLGLVVVGFFVVRDLIAFGRPAPEFPALADAPDPSLHGTVAYFAMVGDPKTQIQSGCVRVVAAAGAPSQDVLCVTDAGYDTGPQLAFLPDGRLEVTMFSWPTDQPLVVAWQKIVDVRTGETEDVPAAAPGGSLGPGRHGDPRRRADHRRQRRQPVEPDCSSPPTERRAPCGRPR